MRNNQDFEGAQKVEQNEEKTANFQTCEIISQLITYGLKNTSAVKIQLFLLNLMTDNLYLK